MLGLAKALNRISYYDAPPEENPEKLLLGYHFDIKPANILVTEDYIFQVADFGQAKFKANDGKSRTANDGGTDVYAAPEFDTGEEGSKYDVWSLGCIFAEIFTFVLKSYSGICEFEQERAQCRDPKRKIKRYYDEVLSPDRKTFERILKPAVRKWLEELPESNVGISVEDLDFLKRIREIILNMLVVRIDHRWSSTKVYQELKKLLDEVTSYDTNIQINPPVEIAAGTTEVGGQCLRNTRYWAFLANRASLERNHVDCFKVTLCQIRRYRSTQICSCSYSGHPVIETLAGHHSGWWFHALVRWYIPLQP
jgi:serine/threonine protein kinase